jgi:hypothetical protein
MSEFDRLPSSLRQWVAQADLPWSAASVRRQWQEAMRKSAGDERAALDQLTLKQARLMAKDATRVWGENYPA